MSERQVRRVLGQHRFTQRQLPKGRADQKNLVADMVELARRYGRCGYRRIAALLRDAGGARMTSVLNARGSVRG